MGLVLSACGATAAPPRTAPHPALTASATPPPTPSPAPSPVPPPRVALLGDGLIDGTALPDAQSLPYLLSAARPDLQVLDLGLGSESSDKVLVRDRDATELHLAAAVIWVGTYDPRAGNSVQQYAQNMSRLLDDFRGTRVVLLTPVTIPGGANIASYVDALSQVASQHDVSLTDLSAVMRMADWSSDGQTLGPTADAALARTLEPLLPGSQPPAPAPKRAVLIGDSLSYGAELPAPQDLPSVLRTLRPDLDVVDTAVGGQQSGDALSRVRQFRLLHPDEVVIWLGTQDAADGSGVARFRDNLGRLIAAMAPARVILVTPIGDYSGAAGAFLPYAAATRQLAQQRGLALIDLGDPPQSDYTPDGVHLNAAAEARVAAQYAKVL